MSFTHPHCSNPIWLPFSTQDGLCNESEWRMGLLSLKKGCKITIQVSTWVMQHIPRILNLYYSFMWKNGLSHYSLHYTLNCCEQTTERISHEQITLSDYTYNNNKAISIQNDIRVIKGWQNVHFEMNCLFTQVFLFFLCLALSLFLLPLYGSLSHSYTYSQAHTHK